ncbi:HAD family hydrolase [Brevibacillus sp. B_LB10_24]|uniref:HAD family hydrolase n=1 Tax=Brevibacillus sp. B_LB10_24 TaxID=3380645 RepID=UPI0038BAE92F
MGETIELWRLVAISTLLLWDIDGTLISGRGAGRRAMNKAFQQLYGVSDAFDLVEDMAGGLDYAFIKAVFAKHQAKAPRIDTFLEAYFQTLEAEVAEGRTELLPGVLDILERGVRERSVFHSLGTGNVEGGARIKLQVFDLNRFFPVGGFSESEAERHLVLQKGVRLAEEYYRVAFAQRDVIVIGDTTRDIDAARRIGARVIAVATGGSSADELYKAEPDLLLRDLRDADAFFSFVQG